MAAHCAGGSPVASPYGPKQAIPPLPADLRSLAVRALDRAMGEASESAELWADAGDDGWREQCGRLRKVLSEASL
ncbi:DUF4259 domain-containing protein [Actinomadura gamaensis]|uniref:DUF4259 domain-containing protein n=1 Tax=Actinomadura gamaensis TaxID=1763541 RepID=A0ABV9U2B9_9ACTN